MVLLLGSRTALSLPAGDGGHVTSDTFRVGVFGPGAVTSETRDVEVCPGGVVSEMRLLAESLLDWVSSEAFLDGDGDLEDSRSVKVKRK